MADYPLQQLERQKSRWMIGQGGVVQPEQWPQEWQPLLQALPERRRQQALLVLSTQQQQVLARPQPPNLQAKPDLPALALPVLPSSLRSAFRRLFDQFSYVEAGERAVLNLLSQYGFCAHPCDWMPSRQQQDCPALYLPWQEWQVGHCSPDVELDAESWDDFSVAGREQELCELRQQDPEQARELLMQCLPREKADARLRLLACMEINLSKGDEEYLQSLSTDRSKKVQALAKELLKPLDVEANLDAVTHLAATLSVKKDKVVSSGGRWTKASKSKRQQLKWLEQCRFPDLAVALEITPEVLAQGWQFGSSALDEAFLQMAIVSAPQNLLLQVVRRLAKHDAELVYNAGEALDKYLSAADRQQVVMYCLHQAKDIEWLDAHVEFAQGPLPALDWPTLQHSPIWVALCKELKAQLKDDELDMEDELRALGLLLCGDAVQPALDALLQLGLLPATPGLDALRFNLRLQQAANLRNTHE